jgi:DNA-binding NtrC family response regulator
MRLLRFLQDGTFERVGGSRMLRADVRVVCAAKKDLRELAGQGRFREDLYWRINTVVVPIPPLRERRDDVVVLAQHFAARAWKARGLASRPEILPEALRVLLDHAWPGNVRELEHAIEHATLFCGGAPIRPEHLPEQLRPKEERPIVELHLSDRASASYDAVMASCEQQLLDWALQRATGNQARAAEILGMARTTFRSRLDARRPGGTEPG